jgi:hypothetical protein
MEKNREDEVFGMLGKYESLFDDQKKTIPGSLVFESFAPFPGYYNYQESDTKPVYLYMALDREYSVFDIERARLAIAKKYGWSFAAAKGKINLYDKQYDVIRLRHLESFDQLMPIQNGFIEAGIRLKMNSLTGVKNENCFIQLIKMFYIKALDKGIYIDTTEDFHAYLVLPRALTQQDFDEATLKVKYNWESTGFDAAAGCFFIRGKLKEMVRIYSHNLTIEYLSELQKLYLCKIRK